MTDFKAYSDNELFALVTQDNESAFNALYHRYWKKMLRVAMQRLETEADAEEIIQDTFVDIWNSRKRTEIKSHFHIYLFAIVRYKVLARMAADAKKVYRNVDDLSVLAVADHATEQLLSYQDLKDEIEAAISKLPEKCQHIFRLSREEGLSDKQIATELDLSQKTVEGHISRALKTLRTSIGNFLTFFSLLLFFNKLF
ncbi:MAG: RNA polymerase sigma-70 factor [Bacteroidota bacterium]